MVSPRIATVSNNQTQISQLPTTHNSTRSLFRMAGQSVSNTRFITPPLIALVTNLKLHTILSSNSKILLFLNVLNLTLSPDPSGTYDFQSTLSVVLLMKGRVCLKATYFFNIQQCYCWPSEANQLSIVSATSVRYTIFHYYMPFCPPLWNRQENARLSCSMLGFDPQSGQVSWVRFFWGFSSPVTQIPGRFRSTRIPNIIWLS